eukprot:TRINITY_DN34691_c0_g1_i1.p1 TRINITY_DN34691_c0_g1~~TRINITY_DN34691_c0_g1_i1.p1  ORF type:complete len:229 (+),score=59.86 TRINITY_DN34691_c0_g1_i1:25-711(+)
MQLPTMESPGRASASALVASEIAELQQEATKLSGTVAQEAGFLKQLAATFASQDQLIKALRQRLKEISGELCLNPGDGPGTSTQVSAAAMPNVAWPPSTEHQQATSVSDSPVQAFHVTNHHGTVVATTLPEMTQPPITGSQQHTHDGVPSPGSPASSCNHRGPCNLERLHAAFDPLVEAAMAIHDEAAGKEGIQKGLRELYSKLASEICKVLSKRRSLDLLVPSRSAT